MADVRVKYTVHCDNPSEKEEIEKEEADQEASQCEGPSEAIAPRPAPGVLESSNESKDLSLLDSSTSGAGLGAIASFVPSKDDKEHKGIRILPRK